LQGLIRVVGSPQFESETVEEETGSDPSSAEAAKRPRLCVRLFKNISSINLSYNIYFACFKFLFSFRFVLLYLLSLMSFDSSCPRQSILIARKLNYFFLFCSLVKLLALANRF